MKNPQFVIGVFIILFALLGGMPFCRMKTAQVRRAGFITMLVAVILGLCFMVRGIYIYDLSLRDERRIESEKTQRAKETTKAIENYQQTHPLNVPVSTNK